MSKIDTVDTKVKKQLDKHEKRITSLEEKEENGQHSFNHKKKDYSKGSEKSEGTTLSGNILRTAATALAFTFLNPVSGMIVGTLALADHQSKGKFTEAGKDLASGTANVLKSSWKVGKALVNGIQSLVEKLLPHEKEQEVGMGNVKKSEQDREPNRLTDAEGLSAKVKDQAKELGKELTKATTNDHQTSQSRTNDISQQRGMGR